MRRDERTIYSTKEQENQIAPALMRTLDHYCVPEKKIKFQDDRTEEELKSRWKALANNTAS